MIGTPLFKPSLKIDESKTKWPFSSSGKKDNFLNYHDACKQSRIFQVFLFIQVPDFPAILFFIKNWREYCQLIISRSFFHKVGVLI